MATDLTECLAAFRAFNDERISCLSGFGRAGARRRQAAPRASRALRRAGKDVRETAPYGGRKGMTSRFARETAVIQLGWDPADLLTGAG